MNWTPFIIAFLFLFVVIMVAVSVASKFWDSKRKKQVSSMLKTAAGEKGQEVSISNLLMEPSEGGRSFLEKFLDGLDVTQKLQVQFQQAGLDWTPLKFVVMALVCAVIGGLIGLRFPILGFGITSAVFGLVLSTLPYLYVRRPRFYDQPGDAGGRTAGALGPGIPHPIQ